MLNKLNLKTLAMASSLLLLSLPLVVYVGSELKLRDYEVPPNFAVVLKSDLTTLSRGKQAMRIRGCLSCHGEQLEGHVFEDKWPWVDRAVAPNLALYARRHQTAVIEQAVRHGIGADGKALWAMPSFGFVNISDEDLIAMMAYMRHMPVVEKTLKTPSLGWYARWLLFTGRMESSAAMATQVPSLKLNPNKQPVLARGEYLAMSTCNECHGRGLLGETSLDDEFPNLTVMIKAYSEADFLRLMKEGVGVGGRADLGLMTYVAQSRFAYLSRQDMLAVYQYLNTLVHDGNQ